MSHSKTFKGYDDGNHLIMFLGTLMNTFAWYAMKVDSLS